MAYKNADYESKSEPKLYNHRKGFRSVRDYKCDFRNGYSAWDGYVYKPAFWIETPFGLVVKVNGTTTWRKMLRYLKDNKEELKTILEADDSDAAREMIQEDLAWNEQRNLLRSSILAHFRGERPDHELLQ